jgi:isopentenyldiphosphate isomerase
MVKIVNEDDEIIGHKERGTLNPYDIYRVSALWIENSKGQILLAQRKLTKKNNPGKWQPAVAGTLDEGETYESNVVKETEEEIGLVDFEMKILGYGRYSENENKHNFFGKKFIAIVDRDISEFVIQEEEVENIKWFDKNELLKLVEESPKMFVPTIRDFI